MGGAPAAIQSGYIQREIVNAAYAYQQEVESGRRVVVGVNKFVVEEGQSPAVFKVDPTVEETTKKRLADFKATRVQRAVNVALNDLRASARGSDTLMPAIFNAVKAYATIGEMCGVLREEFGEYEPPLVV